MGGGRVAAAPDGFSDYVAARRRSLLGTAWLLTGDRPLAEDLVQTVLVKVWPRWEKVARAGDPDAYVRRALVTTFLSGRRRRWTGETPTDPLPDSAAADQLVGVELRDRVAGLLDRLPPRQRAVVVLRFHQDCSEAQTALLLGCSVGTVKSQTSKALATLRADCLPT